MKKDKKVFKHKFSVRQNEEMPEIESIEIRKQMMKFLFKNARHYTEQNDDGTVSHTIMRRTSDYDFLESEEVD